MIYRYNKHTYILIHSYIQCDGIYMVYTHRVNEGMEKKSSTLYTEQSILENLSSSAQTNQQLQMHKSN